MFQIIAIMQSGIPAQAHFTQSVGPSVNNHPATYIQIQNMDVIN